MRKFLLMMWVFLLPFAYADISMEDLGEKYNLGELIVPTLTLAEDDFNGFLVGRLDCDDYHIDYFKVPFAFVESRIVTLPALEVYPQMKGSCQLQYELEDFDGKEVEKYTSEEFKVTDRLNFDFGEVATTVEPGENFIVEGRLQNARDKDWSGALTVALGEAHTTTAVDGKFKSEFKIPEGIKSGEHKIVYSFEDEYGNYADKLFFVTVLGKLSDIKIELSSDAYEPYSEIQADVYVLDQSGDYIDKSMEIRLSRNNQYLAFGEHKSGLIRIPIDNSLAPGEYRFVAEADGLIREVPVSIKILKKLDGAVIDMNVLLKNVGNIDFKERVDIVLANEKKSYTLTRNVDLSPNEDVSFDLTKEVPEGTYSVTLPNGETVDNVFIEDNRGFFKKMGSVTGNAISVVTNPRSPIVGIILIGLVAVLGFLIFQYFKK